MSTSADDTPQDTTVIVRGSADGFAQKITAQCAARAAHKDFLLAERRYEDFVAAAIRLVNGR